MDWKIHRAILIAAIWIAEVLSAGICGFIAALALIPASYAARGYFAFGGEWLYRARRHTACVPRHQQRIFRNAQAPLKGGEPHG